MKNCYIHLKLTKLIFRLHIIHGFYTNKTAAFIEYLYKSDVYIKFEFFKKVAERLPL